MCVYRAEQLFKDILNIVEQVLISKGQKGHFIQYYFIFLSANLRWGHMEAKPVFFSKNGSKIDVQNRPV